MKSKKNVFGRAKSWVKLHAPGGKARQSNRNEKAKLTQIANMAKARAKYDTNSTTERLDPTYASFQKIPAKIFNEKGNIIGSTAQRHERVEVGTSGRTSTKVEYANPNTLRILKESYV